MWDHISCGSDCPNPITLQKLKKLEVWQVWSVLGTRVSTVPANGSEAEDRAMIGAIGA